MKQNRSVFSLLLMLMIALMAAGCDRSQSDSPRPNEDNPISLELSEQEPGSPEQEEVPVPDEQPAAPSPDQQLEQSRPESTPSQQTPETPSASGSEEVQETPVMPPSSESASAHSSPLPADFPKELQTRPAAELKNNPKHLDTRLYAVFQNVMEQNFSRKKGTLNVYRLNADGTEGAYELQFDLNSAYDEKGLLNKNGPVEADMKIAETLQAGFNYGQGDRESYATYAQYAQTLEWLKTPLLSDGFALSNLSSLSCTAEDGHYMIEAVYAPEALNKLYDQEIYGTVSSFLQVDGQGNLEVLGWEQVEVIDDYPTVVASSEYTFS